MEEPAHPTRTMKSALSALLILLFAPVVFAQDESAELRAEFIAAITDAEAGASTGRDSRALRAYILYPYVQAQRLRQRIEQAPGEETDSITRGFLESSGDTPATRDLRREWLQSLAQREDWSAFRSAYREESADADSRCQMLLARIKADRSAELREDALNLWMSGQKQPNTCIPAFDWIKQQGWLTPELLEQRAKLALNTGNADLAASLVESLPPERSAAVLHWVRLIRTPQSGLELAINNPREAIDPLALLDGFSRLARKDPQRALTLYKPLLKSQKLRGAKAAPFTNTLALALSQSRLPEALPYLQKIPEAAADDKVREWRIRSALWNGNWQLARDWSRRLPKAMATLDRWTYWRARALEQGKKSKKQAHELYQTLSLKNNLYGVLAAQRLGQSHTPQPQPQAADIELQKKLLQNPAMIRARELFRAGRNDWAMNEWRWALRDSNAQMQIQAGLLAASWGWHSQAIPALAANAVYDDFAVTYPLVYEPLVQASAKRAALPPSVVYGVMRQESLYDANAISPANAYGLLQLLLPTARAVAKRWKQSEPSRDDLFKPEINLQLGAEYLREMQEKWNGSLILALGSYNAGPAAVARWLPPKPMDADIWIENVPYAETRGYIQRILWHICVFGWKETGQPQDLSIFLQPVSKQNP